MRISEPFRGKFQIAGLYLRSAFFAGYQALLPFVQRGLIALRVEPDFTPTEISPDFLPDFALMGRPFLGALIAAHFGSDAASDQGG